MHVINLPYDLFAQHGEDIVIEDYTAGDTFKGRSILHTNAFSLVVSGNKTMHFAERRFEITDSEFHLLSAGNCIASVNLPKGKLFRSVLMFFTSKALADVYLKYSHLAPHTGKETTSYLSVTKDAFIRHYIESLLLLTSAGRPISSEMKLLKFEELVLHLLQHYPGVLSAFETKEKNFQDDLELKKVIEANVLNPVTLEELAFLCNMSVSTFKRHFARIYNMPPNKWLVDRRLDIARSLLLSAQDTPATVYQKVGYENHSSFTKAFRKTFGLSPRDYMAQKMSFQD